MEFLYFLLIGAISGWLAGLFFKGGGFGLIGNIAVGIVGALIGGWLAQQLGVGGGGLIWHIIVAAIGGWILLLLISFVKRA
ncbi:GlsB/YeaQ/YmgE family stress response membrane protein [Dyadobacter diqingensis]|uniref:GlsB/YeaQ/YmgE family stress response membrane protein n=1 Tax=Dyadobacter diqingensis TaxID=2938121 RepID=UPI0020C3BC35|nr:GlsB/YeaQ/YmgE family stress response membrane protein [Dyadobacter diqingensis]